MNIHNVATVAPGFPPNADNTVKTSELITRVRSNAINTATVTITAALPHCSVRVSLGRWTNCQVQFPTATAIAAIGTANANEYVPNINAPQYHVEVPTKISRG
jgi:hypothetical protein